MLGKILRLVIILAIFLGVGFFVFKIKLGSIIENGPKRNGANDFYNIAYIINGKNFILKNGQAEKVVDLTSSLKETLRIFEADSTGDFNNDGNKDAVVLLVHTGGGSDTFYYLAVAIAKNAGYESSNTIFVGDRIAPQTMEIRGKEIVFNYAGRHPWESVSVLPLVGKSKFLLFEDGVLKQKPMEILSQETARGLVTKRWGDCRPEICERLTVNVINGGDGAWYAEAIFEGVRSDSVSSRRVISSIVFFNGQWSFGSELLTQYKCQPGHGSSNFSIELCQ